MFITCALILLVSMTSTSGDATPPSPKTTRIMAEMIKHGNQMRRMIYEDKEMMERMRKKNGESFRRIHKSNEPLIVRVENIKRREDRSSNSSHAKDEGYEEDEGGRRNEGYRERRNHRRYGGRQREKGIEGVKVKIPTFKGTYDPKVYLKWEMEVG